MIPPSPPEDSACATNTELQEQVAPAAPLLRAKSEGHKLLASLNEACYQQEKLGRASSANGVLLEPIRRSHDGFGSPRDMPRKKSEVAAIGRALEATAARVESLAAQLQEDRANAAERELRLIAALEALTLTGRSAADKMPESSTCPSTGREDLIVALRTVLHAAMPETLATANGGLASSPSETDAACVHPADDASIPPEGACCLSAAHSSPPLALPVDEGLSAVPSLPPLAPPPDEGLSAVLSPPPLAPPLDEGSEDSPALTPVDTPRQSQSVPRGPEYRPFIGNDGNLYEYPEVEVALKVYQVCNVNTATLTFEADFVCHLDWRDPNVEGLCDEELRALDWQHYFNPSVEIDNCKDSAGWLKGADELPRRRRPAPVRRLGGREFLGGSADGFPHDVADAHADSLASCQVADGSLRKTMRFRGTLTMGSVNLRCFPFDLQVLPVRLKAARCRILVPVDCGAVSNGGLACPPSPSSDRVHLVDSVTVSKEDAYRRADRRLRGRGHFAVPGASDALLEFQICSVTGCHPDPERGDVYEISILVERPLLASYIYDLAIMNLLVGLAACAFWDTAAPEVSSRMSISLTVILTLAAYTSSRPAPIEKAPYVTFHDWCEQMCMVLVTGISIQNVFAVVLCGGFHEEAPPYMTEMFEKHREQCNVGWCFSRKIDCQGLIILLCTWACLNAYSVCWLVRNRRLATQRLRSRLHPVGEYVPAMSESELGEEENFGSSFGSAPNCRRREGSMISADSLGSWSFRFWRCVGLSYYACKEHVAKLCACMSIASSAAKLLRQTSPEVCTPIHGSSDAAPRYSPALDNSPGAHSSGDGAAVRGRPSPLDLGFASDAGAVNGMSVVRMRSPTRFSASAPCSPNGSQTRTRGRACPSLPASIQPSPKPSPSGNGSFVTSVSPMAACVVGVSPRQLPLGRGYSHLSD